MAITLGQRSLSRLDGVHPDLVRVFKRAAAMAAPEDDFTILEGVRSVEQMYINYGKGRSTTQCLAKNVPAKYARPNDAKVTWLSNPLMSNHRKNADGFGHAVDAAPYPIDWNNLARFERLALLILRAAAAEGVRVRWGADWDSDGKFRERGETDSPHFELA